MTQKLKRYQVDFFYRNGEADYHMKQVDFGPYVLYSDVVPLIEALKFYADSDHWNHISPVEATYSVIDKKDLGIGDFPLNEITDDERVGGLLARQALASVGVES